MGKTGDNLPFVVNDSRVARVVVPVAIFPDPVDAQGIDLVFYSAGDEQLVPCVAAAGGKVSDVDQ